MRVLIDIGHPAHVHYFKNLIRLLSDSSSVTVTCRDIDIVKKLLINYDLSFEVVGEKGSGLFAKSMRLVQTSRQIRSIIKNRRIDIAMGVSGSAVHGATFTDAASILFDDDDQAVQPLMAKFVTPLADTILSPSALAYEKLNKAIYYPGYHELAYLHPKRFCADPNVLAKYGLNDTEKFFILRFNAFKAHHDVKEVGMSIEQKRKLVSVLRDYGRVFITSEATLDKEFEDHRIPIAHEDIHHFLAFAQMLVSDSQTMTSEAAVLGTPSFRCNSFAGRISYLEEEEKRYKLTKAYLPRQFDWMLEAIKENAQISKVNSEWESRRQRMLEEKIDVTAFWLWFIENYPESKNLVKTADFNYDQFRGIDSHE